MKRQDRGPTARSLASHLGLLTSRGAVSMFVALALLFGTASCAKAPTKPPESALKHAKKDARSDEPEEADFERRHLAPPPAYGNKVVMAEESRASSQRF